ncbi:ABC transporter substrate-binding protein [Frankia canadensis]|uniref:ABC transporter substrate-binding protein n=1 Tax=Frankia canadensis TaxID=1836972 RepID=A0A2I2KTS6_9ACTN|nr:glutamate ABC transporter substrate-binding protein [Frankia canadensis]SNQ49062.1 ABC transporter substrate-binding protein [Frankia canadensis]SOU56352.1 ABC transporter substrate-binding protein [Frankia canadensis]
MRVPFTRSRLQPAGARPHSPAAAGRAVPSARSGGTRLGSGARRDARRRGGALMLGVAMLAALGLTACGSSDDGDSATPSDSASFAPGTTMARLHDAGKITIGTKFDQNYFGLKNLSGKPEGFDVEIAKIITDGLGIPRDHVNFVETVSANREPFIQQGRVDMVVATYTINDKRKKAVDFAGPYFIAGQSIMVAKNNTTITGKDSLAGKKVCSVSGSTPAENIRKVAPAAQLVLFDGYSKCADALKNGQVDAVTTDSVILLGIIDKDPEAFKLVGGTFTREPYGIGIHKGDTAFRTFINDTLEAAYKDGRWAKAFSSTVGKVVPNTPTPPPVDRYTS